MIADGDWFEHWSLAPAGEWRERWPNFTPSEIACQGTDALLVNSPALDALQAARSALAEPFEIWSAYRSPLHNASVGGAPLSQHLEGAAFDVALAGHDKVTLIASCQSAGFRGFGAKYARFVHVDTGPARTW